MRPLPILLPHPVHRRMQRGSGDRPERPVVISAAVILTPRGLPGALVEVLARDAVVLPPAARRRRPWNA